MSELSDDKLEWLRSHAMSCTESEFQSALTELQRHRATMKRLEEWADHMEKNPHHGIGLLDFAANLRNRMKGA